jgi:hypothetical protein
MTEGVTGRDALRAGSPLRTLRAAALAGIIFHDRLTAITP